MSTNYLTWLIRLSSGAYIEKHGLFVPSPGFFKISVPRDMHQHMLESTIISMTGLSPLLVVGRSRAAVDAWTEAPYLKRWLDRNTRRPR